MLVPTDDAMTPKINLLIMWRCNYMTYPEGGYIVGLDGERISALTSLSI